MLTACLLSWAIKWSGEDGIPQIAEKVSILPPQCSFGQLSAERRDNIIKLSLFGKTLGGNTGASLARRLFGTLFKK